MHPRSIPLRFLGCAALAAALGLLPGCGNVFVPKLKVLVDAISVPGTPKPSGQSYRLWTKQATVANSPMQKDVVTVCVAAALGTVGMFEAPANGVPDVFIQVSYGTEAGPRVDPAARETFLQLSARANTERIVNGTTGPEVWDVRVGVMGVTNRPESALPLLAGVAVTYIGQDTKAETKIEVPQNAPATVAVRESAIRTLEGRAASVRAEEAEAGGAADKAGGTAAPPSGTVPPASPQPPAKPPTS